MRNYSFGNYVTLMREKLGYSQYQLGALVGVSDKAVSKWENGTAKPNLEHCVKLAAIFNISTDELLSRMMGRSEN